MSSIKKLDVEIERFENERAKILQTLLEDEKIFMPEVLVQLVHKARTYTKTLYSLRDLRKSLMEKK